MGPEILCGWSCNAEPCLPFFGISHGLWRVCGAVGDVIVVNVLISEAVKTIRTYICMSFMFGPSGHESGEVFNESVMVCLSVTEKN